MGLLQSRSPFILASLYHLRWASSMSMNFSIVTSAQSQPWKSSVSSLPKKPSHLALPGLHPFPGIGLARPFSSHILVHPGQRQWQPRSKWILGWFPSPSRLHVPGSGGLAIPASGDVETDQLGGMPPEQSTIGGRHALPAGMRNSAASVIQSSFGLFARK